MPPVLRYQRFRNNQPRESVTLLPGEPLVLGEQTLIAARWGRYRQLEGTRRWLRVGNTGRITLGHDRFDFTVLPAEKGFRPAFIEPGDTAYLGALSLTGCTILIGALFTRFAPMPVPIELLDFGSGCGFTILPILEPEPTPRPCGSFTTEDIAGLSPAAALQEVDNLTGQAALLCSSGLKKGHEDYPGSDHTQGMVELLAGSAHDFAALNIPLRHCQRFFEGEVTLTVEDGTFDIPGAEDLSECLQTREDGFPDTRLKLRFWRM